MSFDTAAYPEAAASVCRGCSSAPILSNLNPLTADLSRSHALIPHEQIARERTRRASPAYTISTSSPRETSTAGTPGLGVIVAERGRRIRLSSRSSFSMPRSTCLPVPLGEVTTHHLHV